MLSIFIAIAAYRYYAGLAEKFGKTKWHFGLLAVVWVSGIIPFFLFILCSCFQSGLLE